MRDIVSTPAHRRDFGPTGSRPRIVALRVAPLAPTAPSLGTVDEVEEAERQRRLAYHIRDVRIQRGMTPPQLAARVGVSRGTVNKWENEEQVPSMIWLGPLCAALNVDARLFADLPAIPPSPSAEYLVGEAVAKGQEEGLRRARRRASKALPRLRLSPEPPAPEGDAGPPRPEDQESS